MTEPYRPIGKYDYEEEELSIDAELQEVIDHITNMNEDDWMENR